MRKVDFNGKECKGQVLEFDVLEAPHWVVLKTKQGTIIKVKFEITELIRVIGEYYDNGEPGHLYSYSITQSVSAPEELQRSEEVQDKKKLQ